MKTMTDTISPLIGKMASSERIIEKPVQQTGLDMLQQGCFSCRTMSEALDLAQFLARCYPNPREVLVGISELLKNAVEHGLLELSYEEKKHHVTEGTLEQELDRRALDIRNAHKSVQVMFDRIDDEIRLTIADEGKGFNWKEYIEPDPERLEDPNGRGIMLAKEISFDKIEYNEAGNMVIASVSV